MTTPYVPVPIPIGSSTSFTINRNQRRSSLGSISACSDSPKGQLEEASKSNFKKTSVPDEIGTTSCPCNSPLVRTKMLGLNTSMEYYIQPLETTEQNTLENWEDRPGTPTILGYEVMEERAKFTVYKILVKKNPEENWVVFRRYTDFSRLNDKLKDMFPGFRLALPPKRWFKDNYNPDFLEDRQLGLQAFLQNLVAHKDIANCLAVREFLCLDEPPGPFDSLEESRVISFQVQEYQKNIEDKTCCSKAFCETLEETNYRLQKELNEKQKEVETLKKLLNEKELYINEMEKRLGDLNLVETKSCKLSGEGSECSGEVESSATEADQRTLEEDSRSEKEDWKTSWSGSLVENFVPEIEVAEVAYTADIEM